MTYIKDQFVCVDKSYLSRGTDKTPAVDKMP